MNNVKRNTSMGRLSAAWRNFWSTLKGRTTGTINIGVQVKNCDDCRRGGDHAGGCYFCEDAGVERVAPIGKEDGLGVLVPRYCFNCGRRIDIELKARQVKEVSHEKAQD